MLLLKIPINLNRPLWERWNLPPLMRTQAYVLQTDGSTAILGSWYCSVPLCILDSHSSSFSDVLCVTQSSFPHSYRTAINWLPSLSSRHFRFHVTMQ